MSDELPKKVFSVPPPPTDEIDSEWGGKAADEKPTETAPEAAAETATGAADKAVAVIIPTPGMVASRWLALP